MKEKSSSEREIPGSRFPPALFFVYLITLLLMSGIHAGLVVWMNYLGWSELIQSAVPIIYWSAVAIGLTLFTRRQMQRVYEEPMHRLADLISNILKLNKLENQTLAPVMVTYDLCKQLARCAVTYEPAWEKRGLDFEADMEDYAEISADPALMEFRKYCH